MPAAAVIPAPIAYIKAVAVKKLVAESGGEAGGLLLRVKGSNLNKRSACHNPRHDPNSR